VPSFSGNASWVESPGFLKPFTEKRVCPRKTVARASFKHRWILIFPKPFALALLKIDLITQRTKMRGIAYLIK
jgi:hypothetical protein